MGKIEWVSFPRERGAPNTLITDVRPIRTPTRSYQEEEIQGNEERTILSYWIGLAMRERKRRRERRCGYDEIMTLIPDVFVSLNVNLVKHRVFNGSGDVGFHFHGNVSR